VAPEGFTPSAKLSANSHKRALTEQEKKDAWRTLSGLQAPPEYDIPKTMGKNFTLDSLFGQACQTKSALPPTVEWREKLVRKSTSHISVVR
jgi:hypothetical protein